MEEPGQGKDKQWRIAGGRLLTPAPFLVAGIINLTPDSFSGKGLAGDDALEEVRRQISQGAHIVDLGAESTRPGAQDIGPDEEWSRLSPVLSKILDFRQKEAAGSPASSFAISIDTFRARTAASALSMKVCKTNGPGGSPLSSQGLAVDIINDISGGTFDPAMPEVLGSFKPGYVLGHSPAPPARMQQDPQYEDIVDELMHWFSTRMGVLVKAGLPEEYICLDPCIGFGKNLAHNLAIIAAIPRFKTLGRPLFFGISRKSMIGEITGQQVRERDTSTQALTALLAYSGAAVHRVHCVADTVQTLKIVEAVKYGRTGWH